METPTYVVHLVDTEDPHPLKHFGTRGAAVAFANVQTREGDAKRADIYEVRASDARAAVAALRMGEGVLVESRGARLSKEEQERMDRLEWLRFLGFASES